MKYRKLRIAWSVGWGLLDVLLIALWVRSYWWSDRILSGETWATTYVESYVGRNTFGRYHSDLARLPSSEDNEEWYIINTTPVKAFDPDSDPAFEFYWRGVDSGIRVTIPSWLLVLFSGILAAVPWFRWRFSLRTLLIATTLTAVVLGLVVWMVR